MRTVSTKLDNVDHERLLEICNKEGKTVSERLRDLIQECCSAFEESEEPAEKPKPKEPSKVTKYAIYDDNGSLISKSKDYEESTKQNPKPKVIINI